MNNRLNFLLGNNYTLDSYVTNNFNYFRISFLFYPFFILLLIIVFFLIEDKFCVDAYVHTQKDLFLFLNSKLSVFPILQYNLTQLGDVIIFLPFLTLYIVYAPKFWETLLTSLLVSSIITFPFKKIFAVPRPAAMFNNDSFVIIGKTLSGNTSLPSGHSIATFTILISVLFAFMPIKLKSKIIWSFFIFITGFIIAFTRVGIGAHYPLDVVIGCLLGCIAALTGIIINKKINLWAWINNKKYYPIFIFLCSIWAIDIIYKIVTNNLMIFYFSLVSLIATLCLIIRIYVKK